MDKFKSNKIKYALLLFYFEYLHFKIFSEMKKSFTKTIVENIILGKTYYKNLRLNEQTPS